MDHQRSAREDSGLEQTSIGATAVGSMAVIGRAFDRAGWQARPPGRRPVRRQPSLLEGDRGGLRRDRSAIEQLASISGSSPMPARLGHGHVDAGALGSHRHDDRLRHLDAGGLPIAGVGGMASPFSDYARVWQAMDGELGASVRAGLDKVGLYAFPRSSTAAIAVSRQRPGDQLSAISRA